MASKKTTVWVLGDQLTLDGSAFDGLDPAECVVLMIESLSRGRALPYHKQKLTFVWSAMRHFAAALRERGYTVDYYEVQPDIKPALTEHLGRHEPARFRLMETAEYGRAANLAALLEARDRQVEVTPNTMFLSDRTAFARAAEGQKTLRLETFYRRMRRRTGLLMNGDEPEGGQWNYDKQNRQTPPKDHVFPDIPRFEPDAVTQEVMAMVEREFPDHFGDLAEFWLPVTHVDADRFFENFLDHRLDCFGPYEDAIVAGRPGLYHAQISPLLNVGLLKPLGICWRAEARYDAGQARLNSVEGFIRQIIGWREFIYQVYHLNTPGYLQANHFAADLPLPDFYWTAETDMLCMADAIAALKRYGLNHHIQRLMVAGNFALLAGIDPQAVNAWYWLAYTDAYEWVVSPNVLGLALYADGGLFASKPYAASANYINKMSDCCRPCAYNHRQAVGEQACPFNALYWDFLARNYESLQDNPRMNLMLAMLDKRDPQDLADIRARAAQIRDKLRRGERV